jgi:exopolyphosphatase/guanosine-5'-triphosphate,3'-diphosphate pyrophosphatase
MSTPTLYAAVDLGSNSFHLVIMKSDGHSLQSVDCKRQLVRLAAGVDLNTGRLNRDTKTRALRCLAQFSNALKNLPEVQVTAVGTSAFRHLTGDPQFIRRAETTLGQPIRILSGEEEAQYIYRGVSQGQPEQQKRFVLDIGGGSTELIVGQGRKPEAMASLELGCVTLTARFLDHDRLDPAHLAACEAFVDEQIAAIKPRFEGHDWTDVMGSSGSIKAVSWAMSNLGLTTDGSISLAQLDRLHPVLTQAESQQQLSQLLELNPRRIAVFAAGYIILHRVFHAFNIDTMRMSFKAIREGLIDEMIRDELLPQPTVLTEKQ